MNLLKLSVLPATASKETGQTVAVCNKCSLCGPPQTHSTCCFHVCGTLTGNLNPACRALTFMSEDLGTDILLCWLVEESLAYTQFLLG